MSTLRITRTFRRRCLIRCGCDVGATVVRGLLALALGAALAGFPGPVLSVPWLVRESDVIVVGRVGTPANGTLDTVEVQVLRSIKGDGVPADVRVRLSRARGAQAIERQRGQRLLFLKHAGPNLFAATEATWASLPAASDARIQPGSSALEAVLEEEAAVVTESPDPGERQLAVYALATIRSPEAVAALRVATRDRVPGVAIQALGALLVQNDGQALAPAVQLLLQPAAAAPSPRKNLVDGLAYAIGSGRFDPAAVPQLARLLASPQPFIRGAAVRALGRTQASSAVPELARALGDSDFEVRYDAVYSFAEVAGELEGPWHPSIPAFRANEAKYIAHWQAWAASQ